MRSCIGEICMQFVWVEFYEFAFAFAFSMFVSSPGIVHAALGKFV